VHVKHAAVAHPEQRATADVLLLLLLLLLLRKG
jgi:hypothetical protein